MPIRPILAGLAVALFALAGAPQFADDARAGAKPSEIKTVPADRDKGAWASDATFVIIGSFQSEAHARQLAAARKTWDCKILSARIAGKAHYRVAIGPFPKEVVKSALTQAEQTGITGAWLLSVGDAGDQSEAKAAGKGRAG